MPIVMREDIDLDLDLMSLFTAKWMMDTSEIIPIENNNQGIHKQIQYINDQINYHYR